ncbi:hypothetical protein [Planococcus maitriensis]|uniref:Uncharacterized protein n=1 Tax=Planococcus maitriensis TaxID=221799 RepID=A0A365KA36_9BACL|nr:hypothetical protein [Planococcus maitriensis]RAZ69626.1 hypothetical protein DP119_02920 [Planococcus maitriensis]
MIKLLLYAPFAIVLGLVIWARLEFIEVYIALGIIALSYIPNIRRALYKPVLVKRKAKAAIWSAVGPNLVWWLLYLASGPMISHMTYADYMFGVYIFLAFLFGNFVYGLPVSLVSDWATAGAGKWRFVLAFVIHMGFAFASYFFLDGFAFFAVISAFAFFLIDELLRKRSKSVGEAALQMNELNTYSSWRIE